MKPYRILAAGGGTAGSMVPLVVLWNHSQRGSSSLSRQLYWIGTGRPLEQEYIPADCTQRLVLPVAKFDRHRIAVNVFAPLLFFGAFLKALRICQQVRPNVIWTAGGFVAVPVAWAGWCLRIPIITIQQDVSTGLANRLMEPIACQRKVTILPEYLPTRRYDKRQWIGTLTRFSEYAPASASQSTVLPVILILGGSSGAQRLNSLVWNTLPFLGGVEIIHSVGSTAVVPSGLPSWYHPFPVLNQDTLRGWYAQASVVVARSGMNTVAECALFSKALITIPLPGTHQEANAIWLASHHAAIMLRQDNLTAHAFVHHLKALLDSPDRRASLGGALHALLPAATDKTLHSIIGCE